MKPFIMFCKTYSNDLKYCKKMLESFNKFNKDNIELIISVPENEINLFDNLKSENVKIITDESYAKQYFATKTRWSFSIGYFNQEICKLAFWETNIAENYLCLDSDVIFIRDFHYKDFMKDEHTPYTVLVQDKEIHAATWYPHYKVRKEWIKKIWDYAEYDDTRYRTCHGFQVINYKVMQSLKNDFLEPKNLEYKDLIEYSPLEFSWYNAWFQKTEIVKEYAVEHFVRYFHNRADYLFSRLQALTLERLRDEYVGTVLNSNWSKKCHGNNYPKKTFQLHQILCQLISKI